MLVSNCIFSIQLLMNMNFSSRTTSLDVQRNLEANVEKRTKDTYGPPPGKRLIIFIDDMNMPQVDEYGTQQPIALLKLLLERGGCYDRGKDLNWKGMKVTGETPNIIFLNVVYRTWGTWLPWANQAAVATMWILASSPSSASLT
jgi:hypothetical protein